MIPQKAIRVLSFVIILSLLAALPVGSTHAGSARSTTSSVVDVSGDTGVVSWNTFLGTATYDDGLDIAIDASENLYITGASDSTWGSPIINAHTAGLGFDAFVAKMDDNGALLWNTYLGGSADDMGLGIALDGSGNIYVAGSSAAAWGSPKRAFTSGSTNVFVAKLDGSGTLLWNTFFPLGGGLGDLFGLAVESSGNVYISANSAASWGTPIRAYTGGSDDALVAKLDGDGTLIWNTFLGGSNMDESYGLALDSSGNVYVSGVSWATWGTPTRAFTASPDAFVAKLDSDGALQWNTFLGGTGQDYGFGIVVDGAGNVYSTGYSQASWGAPLSPISTTNENFVARLDANGTLIWNTFALGNGHGITADSSGYVYVSGIAPHRRPLPSNWIRPAHRSGALSWNQPALRTLPSRLASWSPVAEPCILSDSARLHGARL